MTHAEQEQQLLDYFEAYRDTINLAGFAKQAGVGVTTLKLFLSPTDSLQRGLSAQVLAKCQAQLKKQAQALQVFNL